MKPGSASLQIDLPAAGRGGPFGKEDAKTQENGWPEQRRRIFR